MRRSVGAILVLVAVLAIAGVPYAAGNGLLDATASSGARGLAAPAAAPQPEPAGSAPQLAACVPGAAYNPACDVDHDGDVDIYDIQLTAGHWGQTGTYLAGAAPPCADNTNRYVDCGNGTVTDTVTGLIWLKKADCGYGDYASAVNFAASLQSGVCGLTDNSSPGDWRLPTKAEWEATEARAIALGCTSSGSGGPALTNTPGTGCYNAGPQPFTNVQDNYVAGTSNEVDPSRVWFTDIAFGNMQHEPKIYSHSVWPVRGGK